MWMSWFPQLCFLAVVKASWLWFRIIVIVVVVVVVASRPDYCCCCAAVAAIVVSDLHMGRNQTPGWLPQSWPSEWLMSMVVRPLRCMHINGQTQTCQSIHYIQKELPVPWPPSDILWFAAICCWNRRDLFTINAEFGSKSHIGSVCHGAYTISRCKKQFVRN